MVCVHLWRVCSGRFNSIHRANMWPQAALIKTSASLTSTRGSVWPPCSDTQVTHSHDFKYQTHVFCQQSWEWKKRHSIYRVCYVCMLLLYFPPFLFPLVFFLYFPDANFKIFLAFIEIVTGMKFTNDCKRLISVSGDRWGFLFHLLSLLCYSCQN